MAGVSQIRSGNSTFETTQFVNPTTSLTVNTGNDGETVTVARLDNGFTAPTLTVRLESSGTPIAAPSNLTVTLSARVDVSEAGYTVPPGSVVPQPGTANLLDGGKRSADIVADDKVICYGLRVQQLHGLTAAHPNIMMTILSNLTRDFSERLRHANQAIRSLE